MGAAGTELINTRGGSSWPRRTAPGPIWLGRGQGSYPAVKGCCCRDQVDRDPQRKVTALGRGWLAGTVAPSGSRGSEDSRLASVHMERPKQA